MSGSQHNPNGRQSQLGSGWNPAMQMQMANLLARSQQLTPAHLNDRGVTWHTPTPPPHMYLPAPSPPDPLQGLPGMKGAGGNSVFRHTATPPDMYRHTPTPPEKHLMRGTPSPGDVKGPSADIYQHHGPGRDSRLRPDEMMSFARQGSLDLSLGSRDLSLGSRANGATPPASHPAPHPAPHPASPALSVRDAPTINSLIARAAPRRVDSLLERLVPSPHSVIVHSRAANTPSPPSSNEDSADSCGAPPGSKRKRKPERTVRVPSAPPPLAPPLCAAPVPAAPVPSVPAPPERGPATAGTIENGDTEHAKMNGPEEKPPSPPAIPPPTATVAARAPPLAPVAPSSPAPTQDTERINEESSRRKTRSGSAETIADIAAMIADGSNVPLIPTPPAPPALSVDKLQSVLGSPEPAPEPARGRSDDEPDTDTTPEALVVPAAAPRRCAGSPAEATNVPRASPSEAKPAEPESQPTPAPAAPAPAAASFVEVENQLEKMFAGIEEPQETTETTTDPAPASKRRKSTAGRGRTEAQTRRKGPRKKIDAKPRKREATGTKEAKEYDSGSNASSGKSRGPYIQIRGGRADGSPVSVCVMNAGAAEEEECVRRRDARGDTRRRGLHASTLGLRYDAATRDLTWLCAFCARPPHASGLGDLFGPYIVDTDTDEYRALDEATRRRTVCVAGAGGRLEAWLHAACGVWAPGVLACGARLWGLARAVWSAAPARCRHCTRAAAPLACSARACPARAHLPCAREHGWRLSEEDFRALCPAHGEPPRSDQ